MILDNAYSERVFKSFFINSSDTTLTVLAGDSPVAWAAHTRSSFPQTRVAVWTMLEAGLVTVAPPQAL